LTAALTLVAACSGLAGAQARADAIPGATYAGVAQDGGKVSFTIAADGTSVTAYRISDVPGSTCTFNAEGDARAWEGAPIVDGWFDYRLEDAIAFRGRFPGPQTAAGTFRFDNPATTATAACDTGTVAWTATTATPPPGGGSSGSPGGPTGSGAGTGPATPRFATRVAFRRLSRTRLGGRIRSASRACRAHRRVTLWRGQRRIATTHAHADGSFAFARSARLHGRDVRAAAAARTLRGGICAAGSSRFIRA